MSASVIIYSRTVQDAIMAASSTTEPAREYSAPPSVAHLTDDVPQLPHENYLNTDEGAEHRGQHLVH